MRKHIILFFSALLFLYACKSANKDAEGIINRDAMIKLLVDIHLVDGFLASQPSTDSLYKYGNGRYQYVFDQHHTDSSAFRKSFKYYTMHDEQLVKMYEEVNKILQKKNDSILAIVAKEQEVSRKQAEKIEKKRSKAIQDSIAKKHLENLKQIRKDSIARVKKDSIIKAKAAAKKALLKPKKLNTTKVQ